MQRKAEKQAHLCAKNTNSPCRGASEIRLLNALPSIEQRGDARDSLPRILLGIDIFSPDISALEAVSAVSGTWKEFSPFGIPEDRSATFSPSALISSKKRGCTPRHAPTTLVSRMIMRAQLKACDAKQLVQGLQSEKTYLSAKSSKILRLAKTSSTPLSISSMADAGVRCKKNEEPPPKNLTETVYLVNVPAPLFCHRNHEAAGKPLCQAFQSFRMETDNSLLNKMNALQLNPSRRKQGMNSMTVCKIGFVHNIINVSYHWYYNQQNEPTVGLSRCYWPRASLSASTTFDRCPAMQMIKLFFDIIGFISILMILSQLAATFMDFSSLLLLLETRIQDVVAFTLGSSFMFEDRRNATLYENATDKSNKCQQSNPTERKYLSNDGFGNRKICSKKAEQNFIKKPQLNHHKKIVAQRNSHGHQNLQMRRMPPPRYF